MTTAGITIRRRKRKDGIDPLRTHSYAVDREMPRRCAACSTERVADSDDVMGSRDAADVPDHLLRNCLGRPALLRTIVKGQGRPSSAAGRGVHANSRRLQLG